MHMYIFVTNVTHECGGETSDHPHIFVTQIIKLVPGIPYSTGFKVVSRPVLKELMSMTELEVGT